MIEFFNKMCSTVSLRHLRTANLEVLSLCNKWQTQKCLWKALSETEVEATFVQADWAAQVHHHNCPTWWTSPLHCDHIYASHRHSLWCERDGAGTLNRSGWWAVYTLPPLLHRDCYSKRTIDTSRWDWPTPVPTKALLQSSTTCALHPVDALSPFVPTFCWHRINT